MSAEPGTADGAAAGSATREPTAAAAEDAATSSPAAPISGFLEGMRGNRVFGWAWCREHPEETLEVELRLDGTVIGHGRADIARNDLKNGGLGDGRHGFRIYIDDPLPADEGHRLQALARRAQEPEAMPLVNRMARIAPVAADAAPPSPEDFQRWLQEFAAVQRNFEAALRGVAAEFRRTVDEKSALGTASAAASVETVEDLRETVDDIRRQVDAFSVFQDRFEQSLSRLEESRRHDRAAPPRDRSLQIVVGFAIAMAAAALALGFYAVL
jgi:hypothetical protein